MSGLSAGLRVIRSEQSSCHFDLAGPGRLDIGRVIAWVDWKPARRTWLNLEFAFYAVRRLRADLAPGTGRLHGGVPQGPCHLARSLLFLSTAGVV